jgi:hypothetical protein
MEHTEIEMEYFKCADIWANMDIERRMDILKHFRQSIFSARHLYIPNDDGAVFDYLRENLN